MPNKFVIELTGTEGTVTSPWGVHKLEEHEVDSANRFAFQAAARELGFDVNRVARSLGIDLSAKPEKEATPPSYPPDLKVVPPAPTEA